VALSSITTSFPFRPSRALVIVVNADLRGVLWWVAPRKIFEDPHFLQHQLLTDRDLAPAAPK